MKTIRQIMLLIVFIGLNLPAYTSQREATDKAACRTTSNDWDNLGRLYPGLSLGEVVTRINTTTGNIDTPHLPTPFPSTGNLSADLTVAISEVDPTPNITLGQAINNVYALLLMPVVPLDLSTVVQAINLTLGAGAPNADTTGKVNFIFGLIGGGADSTVGANTLIALLGGPPGTANQKATAIQNRIDVGSLPTTIPPLPINYPVYPFVPLNVFSDLVQAINQVNPTPNITLGAAINTVITRIGISLTKPITPLISPFRVSSGIIETDLQMIIYILSNFPQATLGGTVQDLLQRIANANPGVGPFNSIGEYFTALGW